MRTSKVLKVLYHNQFVGTLALTGDKKVAFEYTDEWLENGFSISPFSLPLKKQVFIPGKSHFQGLFGVFSDSLPDAWGNILLNRLLKRNGINKEKLSVLDRLGIIGQAGMGALTYEPETVMPHREYTVDLDELSEQCRMVLETEYSENLDKLYQLGGTSGGARPKILTQVEGENWIIKFPAHVDGKNIGKMEYDYSCCAKRCKIPMTETRLFPSGKCKGYFGTKRFDRDGKENVHMCTAAALLELDFEEPSLDYHSLMRLTKIITKENYADIESMYRRMCFNVYAHNRDDHSKNFTYIYEENRKEWHLSPAYDLTYSSTYYGEHTTTVDGNGKNPGKRELIAVGTAAGLPVKKCEAIADRIEACVTENLSVYM